MKKSIPNIPHMLRRTIMAAAMLAAPLAGAMAAPLETVILNDAQPYTHSATTFNVSIEYTRTFVAKNHNAFYVPFSLPYDEWSKYGAMYEIRNIREFDTNNDAKIEFWAVEIIKKTSGSTKPNTPYVFKPNETVVGNGGKVTFKATSQLAAPEAGSIWCANTDHRFIFTGNYVANMPFIENCYFGVTSGGQLKYFNSTEKDFVLGPYRWYMAVYSRDGMDLIDGEDFTDYAYNGGGDGYGVLQSFSFFCEGEDEEPTEVYVTRVADNKPVCVYDLMGRKVTSPVKGKVYVIDNKKVVW